MVLNALLNFINTYKPTNILDLCAGGGILKHINIPRTGIEIDKRKKHDLEVSGYTPIIMDVRKFKFKDNYDLIIWIDGIEHLEEKDALTVLEQAEKHCNTILVFTPNEFHNNSKNAKALGDMFQIHKSVFPKTFWLDRGYTQLYHEFNHGDKVNNNLYVRRFNGRQEK